MKTLAVLIASIAAVLAAAAAPAATLVFTYTTPNDDAGSASWTQSSTPTVVASYPNIYTTVSVTDGLAHPPGSPAYAFSQVYFAGGGADGGFNILGSGISPSGPQIYTGMTSAPSFATGTYDLDGGTLTVTGVPEPAAWSMMLVGVAALGGRLRRNGAHARLPVGG
jgi:hypothetical protein